MLRRFRRVFQRYCDHHLAFDGDGLALTPQCDSAVQKGFIDRIEIRGTRLRVVGWSLADHVTLRWEGGEDGGRPHLPRADVAQALGISRDTGFALEAPSEAISLSLHIQAGGQERVVVLPSMAGARRRARLRLAGRFLRDVVRCGPALLGYGLFRSVAHRARIKRTLGLEDVPKAGPLETRLFTFDPEEVLSYPTDQRITIVMPVYNAFEITQEALSRVARHTDTPWHLVLVEDGSSDARVRPWLRDWAEMQNTLQADCVTLIENDTNLGFIGAVNRGFELALERGDTVVLLNSDALVPDGWASRLIRPIFSHQGVASVTPMSNDAEIFSAPLICKRRALQAGEGDHLDAHARTFHPEALLSVVPTGVGFCMAINIKWLRKEPRLDPAFGRGYGEEVDWCQRVRARGGRHLGLPGLFVEHRGGESFGSAQKQALVQANNRIITDRYPGYDREVRDFITADPMVTARLALALGLVGARADAAPVTIALAHTLGGGADDYLEQRLAQTVQQTGGAVVLRVGGRQRWQIEVLTPEGRICGHTDDFAFIETLLTPIRTRHILYSCGVGDRDPVGLPALLTGLKRAGRDRVEVLFHDFFPLSPSYCLLEADGAYRGPPRPGSRNPAHIARRPDGTCVDLAGWRSAWAGLLARAETLTVFSQDSRRLVAQVYPAFANRIVVAPHALLAPVPRVQGAHRGSAQRIGVLGNIGYQKGAQVVQDMAQRLGGSAQPEMVVIGNMDPSFGLPDHVPVHGTYHVSDLARLAARYGITDWLIPSVWPETFSYTTHEALATGLPVWGFHLGAQGEALMQAQNGHLIHFDPDSDLADSVLAAFSEEGAAAAA